MIKKYMNKQLLIQLFMIALGCSIYAFSLDKISIPNRLADGGISGIALLLRYWFNINPGLSTLILNIPLIIIGYRFMGKRLLALTMWGTACLSFFLWFWLHISIINQINLNHDLFISGVLAGLFSGFGIGLVFKYGGTTGGTDIIARILDLKLGVPIGKSLLALDAFVLTISLTYLDIEHMMYTLLASFVLARITDYVQEGSYAAKGLLIISDKNMEIAKMIDLQLDRGYTFLNAEGGYNLTPKKVIYCVVSPREISNVRNLILKIDPHAFVSIIDVHEALGQGFSFERKKHHIIFKD
ncbi:YitT family protein [Lactobacillus hominis]|uniref:DUF2179 domain-containing protein n=1 Tax=Lactobacillus hominis DSM 23910 = CRBIP 24.179 TaxID=1423758 RepID=I7L9N9_9LACO|nr:YitT family protein [Lactobacillus hominis]KRM85892.1 hypothetical protein FC41_GL000084 [Lactobacillus hominis DSM 23910 = CRBIP 24.179]CCI81554.1 Putative uncharacterized protein [Lactobacillus hominis DSM 23910 = CRBIP 24.179]